MIIFLKTHLYDAHAGKINIVKFIHGINNKFFNREVVESNYMSLMKEADMLKHKSQVFSTMQRHQHNQLWIGLLNGV